MKKHTAFNIHRHLIVSIITLAVTGLLAPVARAAETNTEKLLQQREQVHWTAVPRQVLAFYYGWYGNPQTSGKWHHWEKVDESAKTISASSHFPKLGPYDSHDPKLIEQHCRWAKEAGVTGFIVSWWRQNDFHDQGMKPLLDAAQRAGLKVTIYFEVADRHGKPSVDDAAQDVLYVLRTYSMHPAWLRMHARPVIFVYGRVVDQLKLDGCLQLEAQVNEKFPGGAVFIGDNLSPKAARVFDGIHTYNPTGATAHKSATDIRAWAHTNYPKWVKNAGPDRIACVTVIPGYDDTTQHRPLPRPITERHNGETYRALWEEAIAANPDWVLITTWNEWHEGSEIEPSVENGDQALKDTPAFAKKFLAQPMRTGLPQRAVR